MRNDESDWRRERRRNRIFSGVAAVATVAGLVRPDLHGLPPEVVPSASAGVIGASPGLDWLRRRPKDAPPDHDALERIDRRGPGLSRVSTLAIWTAPQLDDERRQRNMAE